VRRLWAVAWVVGRLPLVTRERIRGGWSTRCAIQIDVLRYTLHLTLPYYADCGPLRIMEDSSFNTRRSSFV